MKRLFNFKTVEKFIFIMCLLFTIFALVLIKNNPATGYELSIYRSTPLLVWIFLIGSTIGGISIIIRHAFAEEEKKIWILGFFICITLGFFMESIIILMMGLIINKIVKLITYYYSIYHSN